MAGTGTGLVTSTPSGIACLSGTCAYDFDFGTTVTLTPEPSSDSTFTSLTCDPEYSLDGNEVTITGNISCIATFKRNLHNLTLQKSGEGDGIVSSVSNPESESNIYCQSGCTESIAQIPDGSTVTLTAHKNPGSIFTGWSGPCSGTDDCIVTMYDHVTVVANFETDPAFVLNAKAIIVAGGVHSSNSLWPAINNSANHAYSVLLTQGFSHNKIQYLNALENDVDGDGEFDTDGGSTLANLQEALTSWANTPETEDVVIFMIGHGETEKFIIDISDQGQVDLYADELKGWLDTLQQTISGRIILVYEACFSGSFVEPLAHGVNPDSDRIVITSSEEDEQAILLANGLNSFTYQFWVGVHNGHYVVKAFTDAYSMMNIYPHYQSAQVDVNSDGLSNEANDSIPPEICIGICSGVFPASHTPVITGFFPSQTLRKPTAMLWADVDSSWTIGRVWAVVYPPNYNPSAPYRAGEIQVVDLIDDNDDKRFEGLFTFTERGEYTVAFYAMNDINGMQFTSYPVISLVQSPGAFPWIFLTPILGATHNSLNRDNGELPVETNNVDIVQ